MALIKGKGKEKKKKKKRKEKQERTLSFNRHPTPPYFCSFYSKTPLCQSTSSPLSPPQSGLHSLESKETAIKVKTLKGASSHITQPTGRPRHKSSHTSWNTLFTWLPGDNSKVLFYSTGCSFPISFVSHSSPWLPNIWYYQINLR